MHGKQNKIAYSFFLKGARGFVKIKPNKRVDIITALSLFFLSVSVKKLFSMIVSIYNIAKNKQ